MYKIVPYCLGQDSLLNYVTNLTSRVSAAASLVFTRPTSANKTSLLSIDPSIDRFIHLSIS